MLFPTFQKKYFIASCCLFAIEALIATFFKSGFIRVSFGDYLVVILLYCLLKTVTHFSVNKAAIIVLLFAYFVETLQWLNVLQYFKIKESQWTDLTLGSTFDWHDMLAYTLGIATVLIVEKVLLNHQENE